VESIEGAMGVLDGTSGTSADVPGVGLKRASVSLWNEKYGWDRRLWNSKRGENKRYWQKWEKTNRIKTITWWNHSSKSVLSCRISVFATVKEAVGHFSVGLRLPSGWKNGSDVPGIFATIHPWRELHLLSLPFFKKNLVQFTPF